MKRMSLSFVIFLLLSIFNSVPALAGQRLIVRTTNLPLLQQTCLLNSCQIVRNLDGTVNQLFLVTIPDGVLGNLVTAILQGLPGVLHVEQDLVRTISSGLAQIAGVPSGLNARDSINYYGAPVWSGYANQPAAQIIRLDAAREQFLVTGTNVVADIDTGVDPNHPALAPVLLPGYDFTRNISGGSEMTDLQQPLNNTCNGCPAATVNQSTAAVLDQSTAAVLDSPYYSGFGHGTMVAGVIHLVAPTAHLMPLKAFHSDGTGYTSDILRAIYYAVQNQVNVINMSFDITSDSSELDAAISYANSHGVTCVASAGNDGLPEVVYPASLTQVMGVASTSDLDTRSSFSNYGTQVVWVAAPGEEIVTTYPFATYAAGSGTSFSSPFVAGTASLILNLAPAYAPPAVATAVAQARPLGSDLGNGRLDIFQALNYAATH